VHVIWGLLLGVQPTDQILEIGFGPGLAVAEPVRAGAGHVYDIDLSGVMLGQASRRNAAGGVTLIRASVH
jgi:ubiquinone/menaquinone biosynthesis C-methylase UbiE